MRLYNTKEKRFFNALFNLKKMWIYKEDPLNSDIPMPAEITLSKNPPTGDCEDIAAVIIAISRYYNIYSLFCLGLDKRDPSIGHAWAEFFYCHRKDINNVIFQRINKRIRNFGTFIERNDSIFIASETIEILKKYNPYVRIDTLGIPNYQ